MEENNEVVNEGNIANGEETGVVEMTESAPAEGGEQISEFPETEGESILEEKGDATDEPPPPVESEGTQEQEGNLQIEGDVEENESKEGEESETKDGQKGIKPKPLLKPEELPEGVVISTEVAAGYDCTYCKCVLNSEVMLLSHVKGSRHKQNMKFSKTGVGRFVKAKSSGKKSTIIEPLSKLDVPVVGLSHIIETQSPNAEPIFKCNLCHVSCFANAMIDHIVGNRHRCAYLKHVDPEMAKDVEKNFPRKGEHTKEVFLRVTNLEQLKGRGSIQVKIASSPSQVKTAANTANRITGRDVYSTRDGTKRANEGGYQPASKRPRPLMGDYPDLGYFDSSRSDYRSLMDSQGLVSYPRLGSQNYGSSRSNLEIGALKHLTDYVITNDEDAKVVSDVVNSLTQSVIQYKLRNLPTSVRELLYKTMNNEGKSIESILGFTGGENLKAIDKFNTMSRHGSSFDDLTGSWGNDNFLRSSTPRSSLRSLDDTSYYQTDKDRYSRTNTYKDDPLYSGSTSTWSSRNRTGGGTGGYSSLTSGNKDYLSSYRKF